MSDERTPSKSPSRSPSLAPLTRTLSGLGARWFCGAKGGDASSLLTATDSDTLAEVDGECREQAALWRGGMSPLGDKGETPGGIVPAVRNLISPRGSRQSHSLSKPPLIASGGVCRHCAPH